MPRHSRLGLALAITLIAGTSTGLVAQSARTPFMPVALAQNAGADETIPLRRIILYRSGVGAFQRQGRIEGDASLSLRFETDQINDILKSMVLLDLDGGDIGAVSYGSKEPLERRLSSFDVDISANPSIAQLFDQLRGARLTVDATDGEMTGTILGVEYRNTPQGEREPIAEAFVNLVTGGGIRSIAISNIRAFQFEDDDLARELERALTALAEHRADRTKSVDLNFFGREGVVRRVVVSYVHEMPVWKTSYRLVLPDSDTQGDPTLQGWAIVENTTDQDWDGVELSLASGRPVGFTMDLYQPLFAPRPEVPVPFLAGIAPRVYEAGKAIAGRAGAIFEDSADGRTRFSRGQAAEELAQPSSAFNFTGDDMAAHAAAAQAAAGEVGEQFMYTLDQPVNLERQRSAMLPILSSAIDGRRVSIYNANTGENPMRGIELRNNAGLHLMPGPISVYDGPAYAGDAQIPHTSRGQQQLLSYAVDLDVKGAMSSTGRETIDAIRIVNGVVEHRITYVQSRTYTLTNNDQSRERLVLVEHQRNLGWDLVEPDKPYEETDRLYRFEVRVPPAREQAITVTEQRVASHTFAIGTYPLDNVTRYLRRGKMSQQVADAIKKASDMQAEIARLEAEGSKLEGERRELFADQQRLRENMQAIDRNSDLYARYMRKLGDQESRVERIETLKEQAYASLQAKKRELAAFIRDLSVQ